MIEPGFTSLIFTNTFLILIKYHESVSTIVNCCINAMFVSRELSSAGLVPMMLMHEGCHNEIWFYVSELQRHL